MVVSEIGIERGRGSGFVTPPVHRGSLQLQAQTLLALGNIRNTPIRYLRLRGRLEPLLGSRSGISRHLLLSSSRKKSIQRSTNWRWMSLLRKLTSSTIVPSLIVCLSYSSSMIMTSTMQVMLRLPPRLRHQAARLARILKAHLLGTGTMRRMRCS